MSYHDDPSIRYNASIVITRTPLRLSFCGGGTDLPSYFRQSGYGAVASTAINRYIYIHVNPKFGGGIRVSYSKTENVNTADDVEHPIVRACLKMFGIKTGIEIVSVSDIPGKGTGLGSSSSFTVGLIHALAAYTRHNGITIPDIPAKELAQRACVVEVEMLGQPIGFQDQYAAAFGGTSIYHFERVNNANTVRVEPFKLHPDVQSHSLLLWTGLTRAASSILTEQSQIEDEDRLKILGEMGSQPASMRNALVAGDLDKLGAHLRLGWERKRMLASGITTPQIDTWYQKALSVGALGGKILGAGGGGFLYLLAPPEQHRVIRNALHELNLTPIRLHAPGSTIIYQGN